MTKAGSLPDRLFDDYLLRREGTGDLVFTAVLDSCGRVVRVDYNSLVLEQIKQMLKAPLFGFACRKNSASIFGTLRVRQIFHSPSQASRVSARGNVSGIHRTIETLRARAQLQLDYSR